MDGIINQLQSGVEAEVKVNSCDSEDFLSWKLYILLLLVGGNALLRISLPPFTVREVAEFEVEGSVGCMRSRFEESDSMK